MEKQKKNGKKPESSIQMLDRLIQNVQENPEDFREMLEKKKGMLEELGKDTSYRPEGWEILLP